MGGSNNHRQTKNKAPSALFCLFGCLKRRRDDRGGWDDAPSPGKVWPSDYDRGHYVGKPGIDKDASEFITRFHETRASESERHTINA